MSIVLPTNAKPALATNANGRAVEGGGESEIDTGSSLAGVFLFSLGLMIVLASVIFATTEGGPIPAIGALLAPFALYLVDRHRWVSLPTFWSGFLGMAALGMALAEFLGGDIEARLLAWGHFMCYLTWIVLWQRKDWRQYWMLFALAVLQVAVGSLLTNSPWLGIGLLVYIVVTLWTLSVFSMFRMEAVSADPQARQVRAGKYRLWFPVEALAPRPQVLMPEANARITPRFVGMAATVIAASLAFAAVAFLLIPRVWLGQFQIFDNSPLPGTRPMTGFTNVVRLGDLGQILENSDPVMEVQFFDDNNGNRLTLNQAFERLESPSPLFRGVVLEDYRDAGRWISGQDDIGAVSRRQSPRGFLRQEILLHPIGATTVFAAGNPVACIARQPQEPISVNSETKTFSRDTNADLRGSLRYFALSHLGDSVSASPPGIWDADEPPPVTLEVPADLRRLALATRERLQTQELETTRDIARFLERWLRDSGEFGYTLDLSVQDPQADPIHDFFFNRKAGHCEYFAATLTMMLRSANIHARMVSGFKGGVVDTTTNVLKIQQLHAHAWVEAWIDGQWLQLDPTPATRDESVSAIESSSIWRLWMIKLQNIWSTGLTWSKENQETLIYEPMKESFERTWEHVKSPTGGMQSFLASARDFLSDPSKWFSWQGGLAVIVISIIGIGVVKFVKLVMRMIRKQRELAESGDARNISVAFYARLESLLKRLELIRSPADTPLEFAGQAKARFQSLDGGDWPSELPADLAARFYSVRFGGRTLDASLASRIDSELDELEHRIEAAEMAAANAKANGK